MKLIVIYMLVTGSGAPPVVVKQTEQKLKPCSFHADGRPTFSPCLFNGGVVTIDPKRKIPVIAPGDQ
jgi:hypothetical protein